MLVNEVVFVEEEAPLDSDVGSFSFEIVVVYVVVAKRGFLGGDLFTFAWDFVLGGDFD